MKMRLLLLATGALAACATPPTPPLRAIPAGWDTLDGAALPASEIEERWWTAFRDPLLNAWMDEAGRIDEVAIAQTRLDEARAGLKRARAALTPELNGETRGTSRRNGNGGPFASARSASAAASALWDPDFFGANRTRAKSAKASAAEAAFAVSEARMSARLTIAQLYFSYREAQNRLLAAQDTADILVETLSLARAREAAGLVSALDPAQAKTAMANAIAMTAAARQAAAETRLSLEALLGKPPGTLRGALEPTAPPPHADLGQRLSAPIEVVARRPDLRAAEQRLRAAGFDSQAARRDFFPKLTFSGLVGVQWNDPETPFTANGGIYNVAGSLAAPLLTFGRLEGARAGADARLQRAALEYRNAAEDALGEVERALIAGIETQRRASAHAVAVTAATDAAHLARSRYDAGLTPLLDVLVAEQVMFQARSELAAAQAEAASAYARLSTSMGIGASEG